MRKFIASFIFLFCFTSSYLMADSIDNAMIEEMQKAKEEKRQLETNKKKPKDEKDSKKEDGKSSDEGKDIESKNQNSKNVDSKDIKNTESNSENAKKNGRKQHKKGSMQKSVFEAYNENEDNEEIKQKDYKSLVWFAGVNIQGGYQSKLYGKEAALFMSSLNIGGFYHLGKDHGVRFYGSASYLTLDNHDIFAAGGGLDYFFDLGSFGVFAGVSADVPIATDVIKNVDVIGHGGFAGYVSPNVRAEIRVGYPIASFSNVERSFSYGIMIGYMFR